MRIQIFISGALMLALGGIAMKTLDQEPAFELLQGALMFGGGLIICGLFSLKMSWHGIIGAGVLALLGAARGLGNLPDLVRFATGDHSRGIAPIIELAFTLISLALLARVLKVLQRERVRQMLESSEDLASPQERE